MSRVKTKDMTWALLRVTTRVKNKKITRMLFRPVDGHGEEQEDHHDESNSG